MKNEIKMNTKICQAFTSIFNFLLLLFLLGCVNTPTKVSDAPILSEIPWDMEQLYHCPTYRWLEKSDSINSLLFEGETYKGKPTEVFAYYGLPEKKSKLENLGKYPGIVLVHGGGGTAFKWWVEKGYAAIAIDFGGNMPLDSGWMVLPDSPEEYLEKEDLFDCIRKMPAQFDSFKILDGKIGEYISVARQAGDNWFIGLLTNREPLNVNIDLKFLPKGENYLATIYSDTEDTHYLQNKESYKVKSLKVSAGDKLDFYMAPGGGGSIYLEKIELK